MGKASLWGWYDGSRILFWRWPKDISQEFRNGCELFVKGKLPKFTKKQRMPVDNLGLEMGKNNIENL